MDHELKTLPHHFAAIQDGSRRFDVRFNDRDFKVGDSLLLREFAPCLTCEGKGRLRTKHGAGWYEVPCLCLKTATPKGSYTGASVRVQVLYVQPLLQHDARRHVPDRVVLSISTPAAPFTEEMLLDFAHRNDLEPDHARLLIDDIRNFLAAHERTKH